MMRQAITRLLAIARASQDGDGNQDRPLAHLLACGLMREQEFNGTRTRSKSSTFFLGKGQGLLIAGSTPIFLTY
jgi:hypothetical protein